ncbi:MAG: hypothetical protein II007_13460 [Gammaproteobacteria bacterium]|nr:hypothetical protein [Gammaproteobacteria bacterium]
MIGIEAVMARIAPRTQRFELGLGGLQTLTREDMIGALSYADRGKWGWGVELLAGVLLADPLLLSSAKARFAREIVQIGERSSWWADGDHAPTIALALGSAAIDELDDVTRRRSCGHCGGTGQRAAVICPCCGGSRTLLGKNWGERKRWDAVRFRCSVSRADFSSRWHDRYEILIGYAHQAAGDAESTIKRAVG